jgi:DNA repair protein RadA/Sms
MAKFQSTFVCQSCGHHSAKWLGKCSHCGAWNSFVEEVTEKVSSSSSKAPSSLGLVNNQPKNINDVTPLTQKRIVFTDTELNRVLGGGLIPGSLVLFGGEPGIGKSTLMLQIALQNPDLKVLYVSGEESEEQIKTRADRIEPVIKGEVILFTETNINRVAEQAEKLQPDLIIVDSIQTMMHDHIESAPGTLSQIRECTNQLLKLSKGKGFPVFVIGHINKEGSLAGPKVLEHMVDTVLQFEGDRNHYYRIIRSIKNRFGSTNELGIYEMAEKGLQIVENPSQMLMSNRDEGFSGITITANMEGVRALFIETQALVSGAAYGNPQRSSTGFDLRRMNMLLAVLEKKCGYKVGTEDVFLNITGGIKIEDPATDLAVLAAIVSSREDIPVPNDVCFAGEVGLSGEVRPVQKIDIRIKEAEKLGFKKIFVSKHSDSTHWKSFKSIKVIGVSKIEEVFLDLFT